MREINAQDITAAVKRLCMEANSYLPSDIKERICNIFMCGRIRKHTKSVHKPQTTAEYTGNKGTFNVSDIFNKTKEKDRHKRCFGIETNIG